MIFLFKTRMFILWPKKKQFSDDYDISYVSYTLLQKNAIVAHNVTLLYEIPWALQPETIVQIRRRSSWKTLRWCILFCSTTFILTFFKNSFLNLKHNHEHILYYWKIFIDLWIIFFSCLQIFIRCCLCNFCLLVLNHGKSMVDTHSKVEVKSILWLIFKK